MKQLIPFAFQVSSHVAPDLTAKVATELFLRPKRFPHSQKELDVIHSARTETLQSGRKVYFWGEDFPVTKTVDAQTTTEISAKPISIVNEDYKNQSTKQTKPIVTFVHGWESRGSAFHKWIPLFVQSGFIVMGWDGPAHGSSPGNRTHAPEIAKSLQADINELGLPIYALVGHSLGGVVVGILSRLMPVPPKIVILSAPAHVTSVFERYHDQIRLSLSARERFNERIKRVTGYSATEASLADNDLSLKTETLLIHDIHDREVPFQDFEELQKTWKHSRFVATAGLGHRRILRDESVAHQIIDFLQAKAANKY